MEALVSSTTGLLPEHMAVVRLQLGEDGSWQACCQSDAGAARRFRFAPGLEAESRFANTLQSDLGFTPYAAHETARRLFEPFVLASNWN